MIRKLFKFSTVMAIIGVMFFIGCSDTDPKVTRERLPAFSAEDEELLEEISYASFQFFWKEADPVTGLVRDKTGVDVCSISSVGFGLAALPIGVERGYISRQQAYERSLRILKALKTSKAHHKGVFCHFIDMDGGPTTKGYEGIASTIDTALLMCGVITAGEYFGGEVQQLADEIFARVNWAAFVNPDNGLVYAAWKPKVAGAMDGPGRFLRQTWNWYTDEVLLIALLGQSAPNPEYRLSIDTMTNWNRLMGSYKDGQPYIVSWPGTLFTYTFAHCFYDFRQMGPDLLGVDWFENSRKAVKANRNWCRDQSNHFSTYGENRWGITAGSAFQEGYVVPGHQPRGAEVDQPENGTLHPYGAAMSVPFLPDDAVDALREMRTFKVDGKPIWIGADEGGYGFWDGFNVDQGWISDHVIGIAQGPMLLLIENARTGLIWDVFMKNDHIKNGVKRAGFTGIEVE